MPAPYPGVLNDRIAKLHSQRRNDPHDPVGRDIVRQRAADACEYCLMPTNQKFEVEHIIPKARWSNYKRGACPGLHPSDRLSQSTSDHISNFAWSCYFCNNAKGGKLRHGQQRLFDPRYEDWTDHFAFAPSKAYGIIVGLTDVGAETVRVLDFHQGGPEGALAERYVAVQRGLYPPPWLRAAYHL